MINALKRSAIGLSLLLFFTAPAALMAQETAGNLSESWTMTVKRGQQAAFETALKNHVKVRSESGDPRNWQVYVPVTGTEMSRYVIRACCFTWADQDTFTSWTMNTPSVMGDWYANVDQYVESYAHYFSQVDLDNSHWVSADQPVSLIGVTDYQVAAGKALKFAAARQEVSQIALNQGWAADHHWAWMEQIGGKPMVSLAIPFENYAAMATPGQDFMTFVAEKKGAEAAAALFRRFASGISGSQYTIWMHRPDLSMSVKN
jgi:hypothetical protein